MGWHEMNGSESVNEFDRNSRLDAVQVDATEFDELTGNRPMYHHICWPGRYRLGVISLGPSASPARSVLPRSPT